MVSYNRQVFREVFVFVAESRLRPTRSPEVSKKCQIWAKIFNRQKLGLSAAVGWSVQPGSLVCVCVRVC